MSGGPDPALIAFSSLVYSSEPVPALTRLTVIFGYCFSNAATSSATSLAAALQQPTTLTVWAWAPQTKQIVAAFEKQYPKITVNLVNAGTGSDEYTKLENAIKAGSVSY